MQPQYKSISGKILDIGIETASFVPEGETQSIEYYRLVIIEEIGGEEQRVQLRLTRLEKQILMAGAVIDSDSNFLDEKEKK